jgi:hypothetical protein
MPIWNAGTIHSPHGHLSPENNYKLIKIIANKK